MMNCQVPGRERRPRDLSSLNSCEWRRWIGVVPLNNMNFWPASPEAKKGGGVLTKGPPRWRRLVCGREPRIITREDGVRGKRRGTGAQRTGNPGLAFAPVMAATTRGTLAQGQNFGERNKGIEVGFDPGANKLTRRHANKIVSMRIPPLAPR